MGAYLNPKNKNFKTKSAITTLDILVLYSLRNNSKRTNYK